MQEKGHKMSKRDLASPLFKGGLFPVELFDYTYSLSQQAAEGKIDFTQLEKKIFKMVKVFGALLMEEILRQADELIYQSKEHDGKSEGFREMGIQTLFGEILYRRRIYRTTGDFRYPLDEKLGIEKKQTISPTLSQVSAYLATQNSYRQSARILEQFELYMSHQRIHKAVQEQGERINKHREQMPENEIKRKAEIVLVESDGVYVSLQGKDRNKYGTNLEIKNGCIYEGWEAENPAKTEYRLKNPKVIATTDSSKKYWEKVDNYLQKTYEIEKVGLFVFGSDGSSWGKEGAELYAGSLHQIDKFHFHRWVKQVFGFGEPAMLDTLEAMIEGDDKEGFKKWMETKKKEAKDSEKRKEIQKLEKTILKNWESLKDYRNRSDKVPEGARGIGNIENFNDNLVADRMKKRGMSWSKEGVENLLQVRAAVLNGEWEGVEKWLFHLDKEEDPQQSNKVDETEQKGPGRPKRGKRRQEETGEWCQAHMPGLTGPKAWLREFGRKINETISAL